MGSDLYFYNSVILFLIAAGNLIYFIFSKNIANFFWFIFIFASAYNPFYYGMYYGGLLEKYSFLYGTVSLVNFLSLAVIYPLLKVLFEPEFIWRRRYYLFFLPPLLRLIFLYPYFLMPDAERIEIIRASVNVSLPEDLYNDPNIYLSNIYIFIYLIIGITYFFKRTNMTKAKKDFKRKGAGRNIFLIVVVWSSIHFIIMLALGIFYKRMSAFMAFALENVTNASAIFVLAFFSLIPYLLKKGVFSYPGDPWNFSQYAKSRLEKLNLNELKQRLADAMENDKIYLDDKLKIQHIAKKINFSPYQISEYINSRLNQNFNDYINTYRTKEAQRLLLEKYNELNILQVGFEAGFNSTATFYRAFHKFTGMSPEKWLEKQK
ncbi:MAG: helix-turn-helix domain-containing protein [Spirochaetia bacterium]|nr:helix-turn-helix domain-containing protein [Spirochaetia bacterium]